VRLASFNVIHGRSLADGQVSTARLVEACVSLDADVLCLQEIDRGQGRSGSVDQTAAVAEGMGAEHWRFEPAIVGEPGGDWRAAEGSDSMPPVPGDDGGRGDPRTQGWGTHPSEVASGGSPACYGVGLVSRLPVLAWSVMRLPAPRFRSPVVVPGGRGGRTGVILLPDEPRVGLAAIVVAPGGPMLVASTHLSFVPGWNLWQLRRLTRNLSRLALSGVLLGDLNVPGGFPRWISGWRSLGAVKTFPADRPTLQIDHALGFGSLPEVTGVAARRMAVSDHRALVVDLADEAKGAGPSPPTPERRSDGR